MELHDFYKIRGKGKQLLILFSKLVLGKKRGKDRRGGHIKEEERGTQREDDTINSTQEREG